MNFTQQMNQHAGQAAKNFVENAETAGKAIKAKEAIDQLQAAGPQGLKSADQLTSLLTKSVGTSDLDSIRLVSLDLTTTQIFDPTTFFLNTLEGGRRNTVTDFTHGFYEEDFSDGALDDMVFDPNNAPNQSKAGRPRKTNTLTAIGSHVSVGIVAAELVKKRGFMDELDRQINNAMAKIKKSTNRQILLSTEDNTGPVYRVGGFSTRMTAKVKAMSNADPTRADIDELIEYIVTNTGMRRLRIMAHPRALGIIHGWLKTDFPGHRVEDFAKVNDAGSLMSTVYFSHLVGPVECYLETALPSGELIVYDPFFVALNGFTIGDQAGPWVISLAQTGLTYQPKVIFDMLTLEDPHAKTRAKLTGVKMS